VRGPESSTPSDHTRRPSGLGTLTSAL
jgi:hypothetical protein